MSETSMTGEASPSTPVIGGSRPRFEGAEPPPVTEAGFKREEIEKPKEPFEAPGDASGEQTALVPAAQEEARTKILPHIEIDYSKWSKPKYPRIDPNIPLRSVQEEAVETYFSEMATSEKRRVIISMATGVGKTVTGLAIAGRLNGRVLWIAHRDELIEQPAKEIEELYPDLEFGIEKAGTRNGIGKRLVLSSIQTLSRKNRVMPLLYGAPFSAVIYDECLPGDELVLTDIGPVRMDDPRLMGLRALAWSITENQPVFRQILRHITRTVRKLMRVTTDTGRVIRCTDNERFLSEGSWKYLTDLKPGNTILTVDTEHVLADVARTSSSRSRTSETESGTAGRSRSASSLVTTCASRNFSAASSLAPADAENSSGQQNTGSSRITSAEGRQVLTNRSTEPSTEHFSATPASVEQMAHASTSHMVSSRKSGQNTRPTSSPLSSGGSTSSRTAASETSLCAERPEDGRSLPSSEMSSSPMVRSGTSASRATGLTTSTLEDGRGGTWTTDSSSKTEPASSTHRASLSASATSSPRGSPTSDSTQASSEARAGERTDLGPSTSSSEWGRSHLRHGEPSLLSSQFRPCATSSEERIVAIDPDGEELVFDLEVEEDHNFITASGFVVHNCHHATSAQSMRVLSWLGCFREDNKGPRLLGLTATIERSDKTSLGHVFEDVIYSVSIQEAIELGFLVPPKPIKVYLPWRLKRGADGDISMSDAEREANRVNAAQATATTIKLHCGTRKTIVFTTSVDQARRTAGHCQALGLKAEWVSGSPYMNKKDRKAAIERFANDETQVLACADLLTEGFNDRSVGAVVIARPTMSQSRYVQMAGRGLRTHAHKVDCLLIDIACSGLELVTADILLKPTEKKIKRKPRRREDIPVDSNTEWKRLQSYLRSARIDTIEHGEITFARASDDMIVTVAMDKRLVILRKAAETDLWTIEHNGLIYTMEPLSLQEAMSVCDTLLPSFGGSAKLNSPEWDAATESPTPPPGVMPTKPIEATPIVDQASQLPLAMKFISGADVVDLAEQVNNDLMNANSALFARGLKLAFAARKCHLLSLHKAAPLDPHKWGWIGGSMGLPPSATDAGGVMIGWIHGDIVCVDPGPAVKIAEEMLKAAGEKDASIRTTLLRTHLGTVSRTFKDMRRDWIKVKTKDVEPAATGEATK